jgi:hypothetical protein
MSCLTAGRCICACRRCENGHCEAIQAATDAVLFLWGNFPEKDGAHAKILGTVTAKAAAPFIVAAERDHWETAAKRVLGHNAHTALLKAVADLLDGAP